MNEDILNTDSTKNDSRTFKKVVVAVIFFLLFVGLLFALYFFSWRPSSGDYENATKQLNSMQTNVQTINGRLSGLEFPGLMTSAFSGEIRQEQAVYFKAMASLSSSPVVKRDPKVQHAYAEFNEQFSKYLNSLDSLVTSFEYYLVMLSDCNRFASDKMNYKDTATFNKSSRACIDSLANAKRASKNSFYETYLDPYVVVATDLVNSYGKIAGAKTATAKNSAVELSKKLAKRINKLKVTQFYLDIAPDPSSAIANLSKVIDQQSTALIK